MSLVCLQLKSLYKSFWSIILFCPLFFFLILSIVSTADFAVFSSQLMLLATYVGIIAPIITVSVMHHINEVEISLFPKGKLFLYKIISVFLYAGSALLLLILFFLISFIANPVSIEFMLSQLLYLSIQLLTSLVFSIVFSCFIAIIVKNNFAYILVLLCSALTGSFFQSILYNSITSSSNVSEFSALSNLFNLWYDEPFRIRYSSYGFPLNQAFFWNCAFYICIIAAIILLVLFFYQKERKKKIIQGCCGLLTLLVAIPICNQYIISMPTFFDPHDDSSSSIIDNQTIDNNYSGVLITSYQMEVKLQEDFQNTCTIFISGTEDTLKFKLDSCFVVDYLLVNGTQSEFRQENSYLYFDIDAMNTDQLEIEIVYHGRVNYCDLIYTRSMFCDNTSAYLPELFAWYPKLENGQETIPYAFSVHSNNPVISNFKETSYSEGITKFKGNASHLFLFSGYIKTVEYNGIEYVVPQTYSTKYKDDMNERLPELAEMIYSQGIHSNPLGTAFIESPSLGAKNRFIFIPFAYNMAGVCYALDDNIILNEKILPFE